MDSRSGFLSIINLASVRALEKETGFPVDRSASAPMSISMACRPFPSSTGWASASASGETALTGLKRTERCAATTVNPATAMRDLMIPAVLMRTYGHADCGIYCAVAGGGRIAVGDTLTVSEGEEAGGGRSEAQSSRPVTEARMNETMSRPSSRCM